MFTQIKLISSLVFALMLFTQASAYGACSCPRSYYSTTLICDHTSSRAYFQDSGSCNMMSQLVNSILYKNKSINEYKCGNSSLWLGSQFVMKFSSDRTCYAYMSQARSILPSELRGR